MRKTHLDERQAHLKSVFSNYVTISQLQALMSPPPARSTVVNAIVRDQIDAMQDGDTGVYIIYLPSAKKRWPERFNGNA